MAADKAPQPASPLERSSRVAPALAWAARLRYLWLAALSVLLLPADLGSGVSDWVYFVDAKRHLGLHLYAEHPEIQIGPVAVLLGAVLGESPAVPRVLIAVLGIATVLLVERAALARGSDPTLTAISTVMGGTALVAGWSSLVDTAHLDDALALAFVGAAVLAVVRDHSRWAGAALGLAILAKPWAVVALPMLFGASGVAAGALVTVGVAALGWLPFVLVDPSSLDAARFRIKVSASSGLRVLGLDSDRVPTWVRPVQLALGTALGLLVSVRGFWPGVPLVGFATRMALDAGTYGYYDAALLTGALIWDHMGGRTGLPIWTGLIFIFTQAPWVYLTGRPLSGLFLLALLPVLVLCILFSARDAREGEEPA